jgi:WD40 repeat protein
MFPFSGNVEGRYPGTGPTKSLTPKLTYRGHVNERNFVGLSLSEDGYIACGSEDNSVYAYHHSLPWHVAKQQFDPCAHKDTARQFVSTVCWTRKGNTLLAANSSGQVKFCALKE